MFSRMADGAKKKIELMVADRLPEGIISPVRNIEREFRALLVDQPVCTCGKPIDPKWTRQPMRAVGSKSNDDY